MLWSGMSGIERTLQTLQMCNRFLLKTLYFSKALLQHWVFPPCGRAWSCRAVISVPGLSQHQKQLALAFFPFPGWVGIRSSVAGDWLGANMRGWIYKELGHSKGVGLDGLKVPGTGHSRDGLWPGEKVVLQGRLEDNLVWIWSMTVCSGAVWG